MAEHVWCVKQNGWIEPNKPMPDIGPPPKRNLRQRLCRIKMYKVEARLLPAADLTEFGQHVATALGFPLTHRPAEGDRAIYLAGWSYGWTPKIAAELWLEWAAEKFGNPELHEMAIRVTDA